MRRTCFQILLCLAILFAGGCSKRELKPSIAERYLKLVLALSERDPDSLDYYAGPAEWSSFVHRHPPRIDQIRADLQLLLADLPASGLSVDRLSFLQGQIHAMQQRVQVLSGSTAFFDQESKQYFGVVMAEDTASVERRAIRAQIAALLGPGAKAYSAFEAKMVVPENKVPRVFETALAACRQRTLKHISMPAGEHVDVTYVFNKPWAAFSRYTGNAHSVIQVNLGFPQTVGQLLDLACHEGYPGHHVFNTLRDLSLAHKGGLPEWQAQLTYSPQSFLSEAAASYAPEIVLDATTRLELESQLAGLAGLHPGDIARSIRIEQLVARLQSAMPGIAREYLDGHLEFARALALLEDELLMEHGEALLLYLNQYRSYVLTYTLGRSMMQHYVEEQGESHRWERYEFLMTNPVTKIPSQS